MSATDVVNVLKAIGSSKDAKAQAIAALIFAFTGSRPNLQSGRDAHGDYILITLNEQQAEILRNNLEAQLSKAPGEVRIDLSSVWRPLVMKRTAPWAIGALALSYIAGRQL